jgi:hypothetical protein
MGGNRGLVYFEDGTIVAETGEAKVYKMSNELFLEIGPGHNLWALESEFKDYVWQLKEFPRGQCLEIGLGLGVASRYILTFPKVEHLTTVEINQDVIDVYGKIKETDRKFRLDYNPEKHRIVKANGIEYAYQTKQRYDFIFIDCYDGIDEDTLPLIADMAIACSKILRPGGKMLGWLDKNTPEIFIGIFYQIFEQMNN